MVLGTGRRRGGVGHNGIGDNFVSVIGTTHGDRLLAGLVGF